MIKGTMVTNYSCLNPAHKCFHLIVSKLLNYIDTYIIGLREKKGMLNFSFLHDVG
jgi:hypothetical protein